MAARNALDAYARAVASGRLLAGRYHRLACERHERDRQREGTRGFPYRFDLAYAERFFLFASRLKHYKGEWGAAPGHPAQFISLQPHQQFRLGSLFAWRQAASGLRRFRTAYNELPRKNGKSLEAAVLALYLTFFDAEPGAEGYCIATKREQAKIVFRDCKQLVLSSGLRSRIAGAGEKHGSLHSDERVAKLEALGADADSTDGLNPHLIISDELHAMKDRDMLDVMETATGSRRQPLNFQITTAGSDPVSPCGDQHDYAVKILERVLEDETFFAFIAHADPEDDWLSERTWKKANPNYGISVKPEDLRAQARKAEHMPNAAAAFKQKRCNLWVNADAPWLSLDGWRRGQSTWSEAELEGLPCFIGIDMSSKIDLTAVVLVFPPDEIGAAWRVLPWCLTPEETLLERARRDRAPYDQWVKQKFLRTNPGSRIDQDAVRELVHLAAERYDVQQIGVDPWNAGNLMKELGEEDGFDVIEVPQTMQQMSAPSKDFEADVLEGLVDAGGHPLMAWCVSNVVVARDNKDNIYPTKKRSRGRIDPVVAALIARKLSAAGGPMVADDPVLVTA
jgi:phage terminase large subunit-like protein